MKVVTVLLLGLIACSMAVPVKKRMVYYKNPTAMYYSNPMQRLMYVQYTQPSKTNPRSNGVATFVAGDTVATGSYVKDPQSDEEMPSNEEPVFINKADPESGNAAQAVAEAYPVAVDDDDVTAQDEIPQPVQPTADKKPKELYYTEEDLPTVDDQPTKIGYPLMKEEVPQSDAPTVPFKGEVPVVVAIPAKKYGPPKKIYVPSRDHVYHHEEHADEHDAEHDDNEDENGHEYTVPVRAPVKGSKGRPTQRPQQGGMGGRQGQGTFFPIEFGGTNGGAIAIANSFSTGENGSATSHAIAYGSPAASRYRKVAKKIGKHAPVAVAPVVSAPATVPERATTYRRH